MVHVRGTGFPWQNAANVYIAGHRVGYPGTESNLVFWDLNKLRKGDEIFLTDADGTRYTYEVFEKRVISPHTVSIMRAPKGKNIVSLQTCTLPDYSHRLIVGRTEGQELSSHQRPCARLTPARPFCNLDVTFALFTCTAERSESMERK